MGWELPGGHPEPGETLEQALRREVREETGLSVEPEQLVGEYVRTGFRPHTARVYRCRVVAGEAGASSEVAESRWFAPSRLPDTLFPWFRAPIADALAHADAPVRRTEHQGAASILAGFAIDLRMRWRG